MFYTRYITSRDINYIIILSQQYNNDISVFAGILNVVCIIRAWKIFIPAFLLISEFTALNTKINSFQY